MVRQLDAVEVRVLGALVEKARTTPDYYPMKLGGLITACNQKTSRDPVTDYGGPEVEAALERLAAAGLVFRVFQHDVKGVRYRHSLATALDLDEAEEALLCVLLLRGPQTPGELRGRTERLHAFATTAAVEQYLDGLARRDTPLVAPLPRQPGQKELRYAQRLGEAAAEVRPVQAEWVAPPTAPTDLERRVAELERAMDELRARLAELEA